MRLIAEDLVLDGLPARNLATFVTTWMEPEAQRIIANSLHRNFIDHAEYPRAAEIEQRCIRMLADLFHAPERPPERAPRAPRRRSCWVRSHSSGSGGSAARPTASPPTRPTSSSG